MAQYTITYLAPNGTITGGYAVQTLETGATTTEVTASPSTGYHFVKWDDDIATPARTDEVGTEPQTFTAIIEIDVHTVSFDTDGNGTLDLPNDQPIEYGDPIVSVTATPNTGYDFVNWTDTANENTILGSSPTLNITSVTDNIEALANFTKHTYTLNFTVNDENGGELDDDTPQDVLYGESADPVTASAKTHYSFVNWTKIGGTVVEVQEELTVTNVSEDNTYTANFTIDTFSVIFKCSNGGTLTGDTEQTIDYAEDCTKVIAVHRSGYRFIKWVNKDGTTKQTGAELTATNIQAVQEYTALFSKDIYVCLGTTYKFEPTVPFDADTLNSTDLNWTVTGTAGGSITTDGIYTPGTPGNVEVVAKDKGTNAIHAYYTVTVGSMPKYDRPFNMVILKRQ